MWYLLLRDHRAIGPFTTRMEAYRHAGGYLDLNYNDYAVKSEEAYWNSHAEFYTIHAPETVQA